MKRKLGMGAYKVWGLCGLGSRVQGLGLEDFWD